VIQFKDPTGKVIPLSLGPAIAYNMEQAYNPMTQALYDLEKPLIVAVNGVAAGGGVGLALLGDFTIAAESAKFVQVFAPKLGLAPDCRSLMLSQTVIPSRLTLNNSGNDVDTAEGSWTSAGDGSSIFGRPVAREGG